MITARVGLDRILERKLQGAIDHLPAGDVLPVDKSDRGTSCAGTAGAADAVQVGLLIVRAFVVDDVGDVVDIDTAGGDIGADENVDLAVAECTKSLLASTLAEVTVNGADSEATLGELITDLLRLALGAREDHHEFAAVRLQNACDQFDLVHWVSAPHVLLDRIDGGIVVADLAGTNVSRLSHVTTSEVQDRAGHGC